MARFLPHQHQIQQHPQHQQHQYHPHHQQQQQYQQQHKQHQMAPMMYHHHQQQQQQQHHSRQYPPAPPLPNNGIQPPLPPQQYGQQPMLHAPPPPSSSGPPSSHQQYGYEQSTGYNRSYRQPPSYHHQPMPVVQVQVSRGYSQPLLPTPPPPLSVPQVSMVERGSGSSSRMNRNYPPPASYCCHKCNRPGHWIQDCPSGPLPPPGPPGPPTGPQPPLPPLPPPQAHPHSLYQQEQDPPKQWHCESCDKHFTMQSQHEAHFKTHVQCWAPDCDFKASKRVVGGHYQTVHGQYSGTGMKEIDIEGQKFTVLVGNSPEDIAKWREERRKKWPSANKILEQNQKKKEQLKQFIGGNLTISTINSTTCSSKLSNNKRPRPKEELEEGECCQDTTTEDEKEMLVNEEEKEKLEQMKKKQKQLTQSQSLQDKKQSQSLQKTKIICRKHIKGQCQYTQETCKYNHELNLFDCKTWIKTRGQHCPHKDTKCPFRHLDTLTLEENNNNKKNKTHKKLEQKNQQQNKKLEQNSLLRKLFTKEIQQEQYQMLQIIRYIVQTKIIPTSTTKSS